MTTLAPLSDREFAGFRDFIYQAAGISLSAEKKALVAGRLSKRVSGHDLATYGAYLELLSSGRSPDEVQAAIDLLTTNETYFFREARQFDTLRDVVRARRGGTPVRVWSAASSSGEEAYGIAMVLADCLGERPWAVVGSDISTRVLEQASSGHYPIARARHMPNDYLKRFCLKGTGANEGTLLVSRALRSRVEFCRLDLRQPLPAIGPFDAVFLRNVLIYFDVPTKRKVIDNVATRLQPGGMLFLGHAEGMCEVSTIMRQVGPSTYVRS